MIKKSNENYARMGSSQIVTQIIIVIGKLIFSIIKKLFFGDFFL